MNAKTPHSGQVALIMVLIMTVVSAVAVSLASRSTIETRIQQMNIENTEALLTAQSGLEESIAKGAPASGTLGLGKQYDVTLGDVGSTGISSEKINPGEAFEINLEGSSSVTGIKIFWKAATVGGTPAIFVSDIRGTQNIDYAFDANGAGGFTKVSSGGVFEGVDYPYATPEPVSILEGTSKKMRVTVLGSPAFIGVEPIGGQLPPQFTNFRSVADITTSSQNVVKYGIEYIESKTDQLPSVFDYVMFSGGSIIQ